MLIESFAVVLTIISTCSLCWGTDVDALLATMTLEEKVGQMTQLDFNLFINSSTAEVDWDMLGEWYDNIKFGSLFNSPFSGGMVQGKVGWNVTEWRNIMYRLQLITDSSKTQIPILYGLDSIHGATFVYKAALFPQAINVAATFNTEIAYISGLITGKDTRAAGVPWLFSPVLGLGIQPLWARFSETFGEDAYLASEMGVQLIRGIQEPGNSSGYIGTPDRAAACMKHFIAYSNPYNGHDRSPVMLPDRILRELYVPAFKAAVETGVLSAMESYQEVGGVPMVSSSDYLKRLLRLELGFEGMLVTDYKEIENLNSWHLVANSTENAVNLAMDDTTIDMSMVPLDATFSNDLVKLVNSGLVEMERVDESVRRILELKNTLGLLDGYSVSPSESPLTDTVGSDKDYEYSLNCSRESITLLQNKDNLFLPLSSSSNVGVGGPTCNSLVSQLSGWSFHWQGPQSNDEFVRGVTILEGLQSFSQNGNILPLESPSVTAENLDEVNMTDILFTVNNADPPLDALVLCVGEGSYAEKPGDIDDLALATGQVQYVDALASTGIPIITVIVAGRPRLLSTIPDQSSAVIQSYNPGPLGGQAIAEAIFGLFSPSGKLPYTYPRNPADIGYTYAHKPNDQCTNATDTDDYIPCGVQWTFGTGLSYEQYDYLNLTLSDGMMNEFGSIEVTATVKNTGNFEGNSFTGASAVFPSKHSILLFIFDQYRRVTPEYKLLKKFTKVSLQSGDIALVSWTIEASDLEYVGVDSRYVLESGQYFVGLGSNSNCRAYNYTEKDSTVASSENNLNFGQLCTAFELQLSSAYNPTCEYACGLWGKGICGHVVGLDECTATCTEQGWGWNYVECLEDAIVDNKCNSDFQCYDPFDSTSTSSTGDCDEDHTYSQNTFTFSMLGCAVGSAAIATVCTIYAMNYYYAVHFPSFKSYSRYESYGDALASPAGINNAPLMSKDQDIDYT